MFGMDDGQDAHNQVYNQDGDQPDNQASLSHELIAGAASFEAMRMYEKHREANGEPGSHDLAKEMIAGFAGAEVDRLAETKGENAWDREKAKRQAEQNSRDLYDQQYNNN